MSSKSSHYFAGAILGALGGIPLLQSFGPLEALGFAAGALLGSSLPDNLEISWHSGGGRTMGVFSPRYKEGVRHSIIPHRTVTHWLLFWIAVTVFAADYFARNHSASSVFLLGIASSGLLHVLMDARTPMGIPIIHPYKRTKG